MGFRFVLGRFHPPMKKLKNPLIHHRPEATTSGSRYRFNGMVVRAHSFHTFHSIILQAPAVPTLSPVTMSSSAGSTFTLSRDKRFIRSSLCLVYKSSPCFESTLTSKHHLSIICLLKLYPNAISHRHTHQSPLVSDSMPLHLEPSGVTGIIPPI